MTRDAIILGTGGQSRVVISILSSIKRNKIIGLVDLNDARPNEVILGVPVLGAIPFLMGLSGKSEIDVYLAIGDNSIRRKFYIKLKEMGFSLPNLVSNSSIIDRYANLGEGNIVCSRAVIGPGVLLEDNNIVNTNSILEHEVKIGSHCHLCPSSVVAGRAIVGDGVFLGAGSVVIDKVQIAPDTIIGAGATVIKNVESSGCTFVGTPARLLR